MKNEIYRDTKDWYINAGYVSKNLINLVLNMEKKIY